MPAPLTVATPGDTDVVVVRTFDAPAKLVFAAHTQPALVQKWLLGPPGWSMPVCEMDFRVGGKYRWGWAHPTQKGFEMTGVYHEIVPDARIVNTETYEGHSAEIISLFEEKAGRTTLTLTIRYPSKAARDGALATGMTGGMEQSYQNLDAMLAA